MDKEMHTELNNGTDQPFFAFPTKKYSNKALPCENSDHRCNC